MVSARSSILTLRDLHPGVLSPRASVQLRRRANEAAHRIAGSEQLRREPPPDVAGSAWDSDPLQFETSLGREPYFQSKTLGFSCRPHVHIRAAGQDDAAPEETVVAIWSSSRQPPNDA
jgi:hypothetical protein